MIDFFYEGIIKSGKRAGGNCMSQWLKCQDHVHPAVEKLPLCKVHSGDLFMLFCGTLSLFGVIGIAAPFVTADGFFDINRGRIIFQDAPEKVLIICAHFIFRPEKPFCKALL